MSEIEATSIGPSPIKADKVETWFNYKIIQLANRMVRVVAPSYTEFGFGAVEWRIITMTKHHDSVTAGQIRKVLGMDKGSMSRAIAGLKQDGWITLEASPTDGRSSLLRLTKKGRDAYGTIAPRALARQAEMLSEVTAQEYDQLTELVDKVLRQAERMLEQDRKQ